tara:strand:- start:8601 stop:8987 length:387 start_codon:yes stop_codon:yes gene_type:complete
MYHKYEHFTDDLDDNLENMILSFENVDVKDEIVESEFKIDDEIKYGDYVTIDDFKTNSLNKSISKKNNEKKIEKTRAQIMKMLSKCKFIIVYVIIGLLISILLGLLLKIKRKMKIQSSLNEVEPPRLY